jgi:alkaline phosphatase D
MTRRELLRLAGWLGFAPFFAGGLSCSSDEAPRDRLPEYEYDGEPGPATLFSHGVASGDPLPGAVILWTRVSPVEAGPVDVFWEMARDEGFVDRVAAGWSMTDAFRDYTVKVEATGLLPGSTWYYRFRSLGRSSPVGRTRTAPLGATSSVRLAVCSCSDYSVGYFYGYRFIAQRTELDAVVHLGDYIYEYGARSRDVRPHDPPHECVSLDDYRRRYAQHHTDPDLQEAHRQHPFVIVWDDHETANNSWRDGAQNHDPSEGEWSVRKAAAQQAWAEWLPVRESADGRIFRSLSYGDLAELIMLDARLWGRDAPAASPVDREVVRDPERSVLGADQEAWLIARLMTSPARWKLVGNQVMFAHLKGRAGTNAQGGGDILNVDQWDGYWANRERILTVLREHAVDNVVVLTGDIHSSWALDVSDDPNNPEVYDPVTGVGSLAVELIAPGITSGIEFAEAGLDLLLDLATRFNPHIRWLELNHRGYFVLDVTPERARATWWLLEGIDDPVAGSEYPAAVFEVREGENRLVEAT